MRKSPNYGIGLMPRGHLMPLDNRARAGVTIGEAAAATQSFLATPKASEAYLAGFRLMLVAAQLTVCSLYCVACIEPATDFSHG